jgi:hypothetical protein
MKRVRDNEEASWYGGPDAISNAIGYAQHRSRSHDAVISF